MSLVRTTSAFVLTMSLFMRLSSLAIADDMTLEAVYLAALEKAPELAIARYRVDAADAQVGVAKGRVLPQLSLFAQWSENDLRYDAKGSQFFPDQDYPGERYGFQFRQTIFNMSAFQEVQLQNALLSSSRDNLEQAGIELLLATTEAYLQAVVSDEAVELFRTESIALDKQYEEAEALYQRALLPVTQVLEAKTRSDSLKADLSDAVGQAAIAREKLAELIGMRNINPMPLSLDLSLDTHFLSAEAAAQDALRNSPAVSAAEERVQAALAKVDREKGAWWPEVDLVYSHQYSDVGFDNLSSPPRTSESIQVEFNYPLIQGGSGAARIRGARAEFYASQQELERVRRAIETQARSSWFQLKAAQERLQAARQAVETSEVNVDAARKSVKAGTARVTDVLLALAQRTRSQRDRSYAQLQLVMAWLDLELTSGALPGQVAPDLSDALLVGLAYTPPLSK